MPYIVPGEDGDNRPTLAELRTLGFREMRDFSLYQTWDGQWMVQCNDRAYADWQQAHGVEGEIPGEVQEFTGEPHPGEAIGGALPPQGDEVELDTTPDESTQDGTGSAAPEVPAEPDAAEPAPRSTKHRKR